LEEVKKVQSQSEGSGGGFFPADVFTRLAAHPRFGPKLADPTFVAKLRALQQNPSLLQMYISDPDIMDVFGVSGITSARCSAG
jgi:stress-induced-phosphoprotein 1